MKKINKTIINNEEIFLKKDWLGWRTIEPIRHPETNQFLWKNFFSKKGFVLLLILILILSFTYLAFKEGINNYREVMKNPCKFCKDYKDIFLDTEFNINISSEKWET